MPSWASTVAELDPDLDGLGVIPLGSGIDTDLIFLVWDPGDPEAVPPRPARWIGDVHNIVHSGDTTPIIFGGQAAVTVKQGMGHPDDGSTWGAIPLRKVDEAYTAGLTLEYRHKAFLQSTAGNVLINVGAYLYEFDNGDSTPEFTAPPTLGVAETGYLHGGVPAAGHSAYEWNESPDGWLPLPLLNGNPSKSILYPKVMGFMDSGAAGTSEVGYALFLRWIYAP